MRLTCPNCDAQYEVPDDVIPQDGRDVQCSNCGNTWFQAHADQVSEVVEDPEGLEQDTEWTPEVAEDEPLQDPTPDAHVEPEEPQEAGPVTMSADAPDEVLAAAVKAAIRRAKPDQEDEIENDEVEDDQQGEVSFEEGLEASLNELSEEEPEEDQAAEDAEDRVYYEPAEVDPEEDQEAGDETEEPKRRTIDPTVANILQEEAALEAERRAEETSLESQPDLGLEEAQQEDAAKRARQARERMARMRGLPADAVDKPVEPIPANSRRDLLPDIEEINSTLRATEDRAPEEQPDGRPTVSQRRAGGNRIGFAMALLLIALLAYIYNRPDVVSATIPGSENYVAAFVNFVDNARISLDSQMTKLMLWLDGLTSES